MAASYQQSKAEQAALASGTAKTTPQERSAMVKRALNSQTVRKKRSYWSKVRFQWVVTGSGPWTYTINTGLRISAFSYGKDDALGAAQGFLTTFGTATEAETNLLQKGDTGGATVKVYGLSFYLSEKSDAELTKEIWDNAWSDITLDGSTRYLLLGKPGRIPASGGLFGSGRSYVVESAQNAPYATVDHQSNGYPHQDNVFSLPSPITWNPVGAQDSKLQVRFGVDRTLTYTAAGRPAPSGTGVTVPIAGWVPPTTTGANGTFVDITVYLACVEEIPRSTNG